jgi:hypothetical protein
MPQPRTAQPCRCRQFDFPLPRTHARIFARRWLGACMPPPIRPAEVRQSPGVLLQQQNGPSVCFPNAGYRVISTCADAAMPKARRKELLTTCVCMTPLSGAPDSRFRTTPRSDLTIALRLFLRSTFADLLVTYDGSTIALISEVCRAVCAHRPSSPIFPALLIIPSTFHFHGSAGRRRRRTVDFTAWRGAPDHPPRHSRASATSRRHRHAANPPRAPPRSVLSTGVRPCGRRRKPGGAAVESAVRFSHRFLSAAAAMVGAEPSSSAAAAAAAAAMGPLTADRAARRRRRAAAWRGARRPSSGP